MPVRHDGAAAHTNGGYVLEKPVERGCAACVHSPQQVAVRLADLSQDADGQPRPRERVAVDGVLRQAQLATQRAHLRG